ncbi:hypothetical protein PISMIDRAFT_18916 [Pisolithus microcarpus 441]|uniref:Uncharacterized protein n=1 Tax=Pisolithus microcarpus 441 TaxID=765257 RepID=A0A0C9Y5B5_9AGAM|nr:hypothetical protein PISMIDRAFT_18916 [Pisolithus microcarpus 441]
MRGSLRQNRSSSRYQPYLGGSAGRPSPTSPNLRPRRLTRSNAVILQWNLGGAHSVISTPSHSSETTITMPRSTTTDFDSTGPPPDTLVLTTASETLNSTTTTTLETLDSASSFKTAAGNDNEDESVSADEGLYFSASSSLSSSSVVIVNSSPTTSFPLQPTSINLPLAFKQSVRRAVQRRLRRYAPKLDPETCKVIELGISDAIDLALRILERSHKPPNMLPFTGTAAATHFPVIPAAPARLRSAALSSVLSHLANNFLTHELQPNQS